MNTVDTLQLNLNSDGLLIMNISLAIIMFGVALELTTKDFKSIASNPKSVLTGIISQFFLLPFLTYLLVVFIKPAPSIALGMMMVAACPGGNVSNFFSLLSKSNIALSVSLTAISTFMAMIMTPLNFAFWASMYGPTNAILKQVSVDPMEVIKIITLILGMPLILGMLVNRYKSKLALKLGPWIKGFGILFFTIFVLVAFALNYDNFLQFIKYIFLLVLVHNVLAFNIGYTAAHAAKLPREDKKSIAIETGIQNSGLGLVLILNFFDGLGGMALVAAWWGIWHMISGFGLSWYWSIGKSKLQRVFSNA